MKNIRKGTNVLLAAATFAGAIALCTQAWSQGAPPAAPLPVGHGPTADDWSAIAKLPDWTGIWQPDVLDQNRQARENNYPWTLAAAAEIDKRIQLEKDGKPGGSHNTCLPWGMPGFMAITHNTIEMLYTPGRVTILGELDGNNLRRIYTDGRPHPKDGDITYHGHSIGNWRGTGQTATLDVDTVDILPEVEIALSEGVGIPGGDGIHVVEHMHLVSTNVLADDMEVTAPKVLDTTYKTRRMFFRRGWGPEWDIVEGVCVQGSFIDQVDPNGFAIFVPKARTGE